MRKIIHIDMDAFYAAIEQRDDPSLRGRPVAVGAGAGRGVVMTASYEARQFGVHSAMPSGHARRLCPELRFVPPRFDVYKVESRRIHEVFARATDLIEPVSLDEAYLDVTEPKSGPMPAMAVAQLLKAGVRDATGLTASAGVSFNKFLAKMASGLEKPDGLTVIRPEQALAFLAALPIERFHGVGPATARRMRRLGITCGADLQSRGEHELVEAFGRTGGHYWRMACAQDDRVVEPDRPRRSLSIETTFDQDLRTAAALRGAIRPLAEDLAIRVQRARFFGRTLTLKLRYADFTLASRRTTRADNFLEPDVILTAALELLAQRPRPGEPIRLLGLGVSTPGTSDDPRQLGLELTETSSAGR
ncbi:MAG: DNA polymerase IV [Geminicoccaceae bacterium]